VEIRIDWHNDQFNVQLASKPGEDEFLSIKGCRIVDGAKGAFVSWPATKNTASNKWWSHVWASDKFAAVVLSKAQETMPSRRPAGQRPARQDDDAPPPRRSQGYENERDPF
jgi:DNA-binding cell septation regulator SpoVG